MSIQIVEKRYNLYLSRSTPGVVTLDGVQRLRNKEINAADNTIIGLEPEIPKALGAAVWTEDGWVFDDTAYIPASAVGVGVQAYPIGTAITFINQNGAGVLTIAITTDTMRLAGAGTTGSRTLAANGVATAVKVAAAEWIISGVGLT